MLALKPITIVGGGLAGLTLGIGLRRQHVPVTVWEAGHYPRHRVCGEFISGGGQAVLDRLGLRDSLENAGAFPARTVQFIAGSNRSPVRSLPDPALCLSRHALDDLLARQFRELGGDLRENARWSSAEDAEGIVRAAGRRAQSTEQGWRWFGIKAHVRNVTLAADLEMHVSSDGYVGVNRINDGEVNVCGLFRAAADSKTNGSRTQRSALRGLDLLRGQPGSPLQERLANAVFDDASVCTVAGLSLKPQRAVTRNDCCIGDALTMIPPVTGNGMSMAFESASIAIEPLAAYSRGEIPWSDARQTIASSCDTAFSRRLAWARRLQWLMFSPVLQTSCGSVLLRSDSLWRWMFARTR